MRLLFCTFFLFGLISVTLCQEISRKELRYKPKNLTEAVQQLQKMITDSTEERLRNENEDNFGAKTHFALGLWIRNNWGLWSGGLLADYFNSIGVTHPDDMSGIILTCYHRELNGKPWDVDSQIVRYQEYWRKSNEHFHRLETDTAYQRQVKFKQDSLSRVMLEEKKKIWSPGKRVAGYIDQCGIHAIGLRLKVYGTILAWKDNKLHIHIDKYADEKKKKRLQRCNEIIDDNVIVDHYLFDLEIDKDP